MQEEDWRQLLILDLIEMKWLDVDIELNFDDDDLKKGEISMVMLDDNKIHILFRSGNKNHYFLDFNTLLSNSLYLD